MTQIPDEFAFRHFVLHVRGCQVDAEHYERITENEDGVFVQAQVRVTSRESVGELVDKGSEIFAACIWGVANSREELAEAIGQESVEVLQLDEPFEDLMVLLE